MSGKALIAAGAIIFACVLSITSYEIWRQRQSTLHSAQQSMASLSMALAEQTERAFQSAELVLAATQQSIRVAGGIKNAGSIDFHQTMKERIAGIPVLLGLAIIDRDGRVVSSARSFPPPAQLATERDYFIHHANHADRAVTISAPRATPVDGRMYIPVTQRISGSDGSFQGVVLAAVDPTYFQDVYSRLLPEEAGAFTLFRSDAMLLARQPAADKDIGKRFPHLPMFAPGKPDKGISSGPSPIDGHMRIASYNKMSRYPLAISISVDQDTLLAPWRGNAIRLAFAALAATTILVVTVLILLRQLEREQVQAAALRKSEQRLNFAQFALDNAADMALWIDLGGHVLYANAMACERLGYEADEMVTRRIGDIDRTLEGNGWPALLADLVQSHRRRFDAIHTTRTGEDFPAEMSVNYVEFGGAGFVCAFVRDITERKQAEAVLAEKTTSLEASNAELEQFAYVASHDLREPLRMVNSFVTMLAQRYADKLDQDGRDFIAFAQDGAVRMDRLILDLLEYSRVGRLDRPTVPTSLAQAVDLAVKGLALAAQEGGATIEIVSDLPDVLSNDEELMRLFLNLVGNALKYRHPDRAAKVSIGAQRQGGEITCWVADNGIGIQAQDYERVFRIFQRLHGRDRYDGTGIGLAICKKIVERQGGRIWIESSPDEGSKFLFTLRAA